VLFDDSPYKWLEFWFQLMANCRNSTTYRVFLISPIHPASG